MKQIVILLLLKILINRIYCKRITNIHINNRITKFNQSHSFIQSKSEYAVQHVHMSDWDSFDGKFPRCEELDTFLNNEKNSSDTFFFIERIKRIPKKAGCKNISNNLFKPKWVARQCEEIKVPKTEGQKYCWSGMNINIIYIYIDIS
eukprot:GHVR01085803.1.p1 GENE.GHVR01085803.1~~GHVR01085803.1.p1  ORF type:complete len:147 (+),score=16.52 GHVR01085803.1:22-462(+)